MIKGTGGNALLDVNLILEKSQLKEKMKIADFGCGSTGHFVFPASRIVGRGGTVYAIDILKTVLETIKRRVKQESTKNIITVWSDMEIFKATKINSESLDIGLLINTLYQSKKRLEILRETIRMMKKGSKLLIVEWENASSPLGPPAEDRVKAEQLKKVCEKLGLKINEEFDAGEYHYGILFTKL